MDRRVDDVLGHGKLQGYPVPPLTPYLGVTAVAYDADPYAGYVLWTDDPWGSNHYLSAGIDSRCHIEPP